MRLADEESATLWTRIRATRANLAPRRTASVEARERKAADVRANYVVDGPLTFLHFELADNRTEFLAPLRVAVREVGCDFVVEVTGAVATANTIAYVSEMIAPSRTFVWLTRRNLMSQSMRYLLLGEGEVGLKVYEILRYWEWRGDEHPSPRICLTSD